MRIGVGGVFQETNTFATDWLGPAGVDRFVVSSPGTLERAYRGTLTEIGGALAAADELGATVVPLTFAIAAPGPTVARDAYETMASALTDDLRAGSSLDAVVLVLHGAGAVEEIGCLEGDLLARVRGVLGPDVPVVATLDLHAMVPADAFAHVDVLLPYHHYPHTDMAERGREAVAVASRLAERGRSTRTAVAHVPLLVTAGCTDVGEPMREVLDACLALEERAGVVDVSVQHGFPFCDVPDAGVHVTATVDADSDVDPLSLAEHVAGLVWARRDRLVGVAVSADEAVRQAQVLAAQAPSGSPVVIGDSADNPGGGAPGDATHLLCALLAAGEASALVAAIADPVTVRAATAAGVGAVVDVELGGHGGPLQGEPVRGQAQVRALTDGRWVATTAMGAGASYDMGPTALLRIDGIDVVVCSEATQVFDPAIVTIHGVRPSDYAVVVVKSSTHFRAGFSAGACAVIVADAPGVTSLDVAAFPRTAVPVPLYPIAAHDGWAPTATIGGPA